MFQEITKTVKNDIAQVTSGWSGTGAVSAFFNMFQGRCTFAAICFSITGMYGWLHGKDLTSFALFVTAVQGLLVLHSAKEDLHEQRMADWELRKLKQGDTLESEIPNVANPSRDTRPMAQ
jgi:hypothetical protein